MQLNEFTLSLLYLGLPGVVASFFLAKLTGVRAGTVVTQVLLIFVLSVLTYAVLGLWDATFAWCAGRKFILRLPAITVTGLRDVSFIFPSARALCMSVVVSYVLAFCHNNNFVNKAGQMLRVTNRYGDEDVWHFFHRSPQALKQWLFVRDLKVNLVYFGYVSAWSETGEDRELVLSEVIVYTNDTREHLYECAQLYICRGKDELTIEVPSASPSPQEGEPKSTSESIEEVSNVEK